MIDHKHKIIFVHIPRTGGSSLEIALTGREWSTVDNRLKHLTASHTRKVYKRQWNKYKKITIVRNPFDRVISLFRGPHRAVYCDPYKNDLKYFLENFKPAGHEPKQIQCCDIIDCEMDYIFRTETLQNDFDNFCFENNIPQTKLPRDGKTLNRKPYQQYYNEETKQLVEQMWKDDILKYNYIF